MRMTQSHKTFDTLKTLAANEVDAATEKLMAINRLADEAENKLEMLQQYRNDYRDRLAMDMEAGLPAKLLMNFQNFLAKLDQAIAGQQEMVDSIKKQYETQQGVWQESQKKKLTFDVLVEKSEKQARHHELKKEQKLMDEHAARSVKRQ